MTDSNVTPIRNAKGQFVKGQSGNRGGKPKPYFAGDNGTRTELAQHYLDNAGVVFSQLLRTIVDPKTPASARVAAIKEFNDRALGKAQNHITVKNDDGIEVEYEIGHLDTRTLAKLKEAKIVSFKGSSSEGE